jgi:carbonic anhydrase
MSTNKSLKKLLKGYEIFRDKYAHGEQSIMHHLSRNGQQPKTMVIACCDSRVDPALILQCNPGDLFVVRNVANIVPPYEKDEAHHGTSAALEFGICYLHVEHLVLLGHSQCSGIQALLKHDVLGQDDFITNWVTLIKTKDIKPKTASMKPKAVDECAKQSLHQSRQNCLTFPWIKERIEQGNLLIHLWFFDIKTGQIFTYSDEKKTYQPLAA